MINFMRVAPAISFLAMAGCANALYHGTIEAEDSSGIERETVLYWTKTDPLIGAPKADAAVLRTGCGTPVLYESGPHGIVFHGRKGEERPADRNDSVEDGAICGRILGYERLVDVDAGAVQLTITCKPLTGEFSVGRTYLEAREEPYTFPIEVERRWSLFGTDYETPVPACP